MMDLPAYIALITSMIAGSLNLEASRRLLSEVLYTLYQHSPETMCLGKVVETLHHFKAHPLSRAGQYKEALLFSLADVWRQTGDSLNYVSSSFFPEIFSRPRTFIISCGNYSSAVCSLIISLFYFYIYETRRQTRHIDIPILLLIDDAMSLLLGSLLQEREHQAHPLIEWIRLTRALNSGSLYSGQNFSEISNIIRNNCQTLLSLGSTGQDALDLARHMNLTEEQAAVIPQLVPGEGIVFARGQWPFAQKILLPNYNPEDWS
jgi:hypothetical protein